MAGAAAAKIGPEFKAGAGDYSWCSGCPRIDVAVSLFLELSKHRGNTKGGWERETQKELVRHEIRK